MKIVDKSKEHYPDLEGAIYLVVEDDRIPEDYEVSGVNVYSTGVNGDEYHVDKTVNWGWSAPCGFDSCFGSAEEALDELLRYLEVYVKNHGHMPKPWNLGKKDEDESN